MIRAVALLSLVVATPCAAASPTDFGVRTLKGKWADLPSTPGTDSAPTSSPEARTVYAPLAAEPAASRSGVNLGSVAAIGAKWGRVTSLRRSPAHNRRVGGVRNSYHLSGRAIDIARRAGVRHSDIAAAFRAAGYNLVESLDEGDHSHFAFGGAGSGVTRSRARRPAITVSAPTGWKMVYAPRSR